jgi:hypothetical protein
VHAESIPAANRNEVVAEFERVEKAHREGFELVRANRKAKALGAKARQDCIDVRVGARSLGDVGAVMIDESVKHPIDLWLGRIAAFGRKRSLDHAKDAAANHPSRIVVVRGRQAFADENAIEREDEIGRGIDQCAVEIERDGQHDFRNIRCDDGPPINAASAGSK